MSDSNNTPNRPTHIAYHITERGGKSYWTRIGAAWQNKDGNGFNIDLELTPLDGKVTLRIATEKKDAEEQA